MRRKRPRLPSWLRTLACLAAVLLPCISTAGEQRCTDLGANCICHRSLAATSWVSDGNGFYHEALQNLSDTRLCNDQPDNLPALIWTSGSAPKVGPGLNGFAALWDTSETGDYLVVEPNAAQRMSLAGKRVAVRYYLKYGASYVSASADCSNDKYIQIGGYFTAQGNYTSSGGGGFSPPVGPSEYLNKWIRIEMVMDKYASSDIDGWTATYTVYLKNVSDNTPEISFTFQDPIKQNASDLENATNLVHRYRAGNGCSGQTLMMFAMLAAWSNPTGTERIGPALELEGQRPSVPKNISFR